MQRQYVENSQIQQQADVQDLQPQAKQFEELGNRLAGITETISTFSTEITTLQSRCAILEKTCKEAVTTQNLLAIKQLQADHSNQVSILEKKLLQLESNTSDKILGTTVDETVNMSTAAEQPEVRLSWKQDWDTPFLGLRSHFDKLSELNTRMPDAFILKIGAWQHMDQRANMLTRLARCWPVTAPILNVRFMRSHGPYSKRKIFLCSAHWAHQLKTRVLKWA